MGDRARQELRAGRVRGAVRPGARDRPRARRTGRRSRSLGKGRRAGGGAPGMRACIRGSWGPPDPRRDPRDEPSGTEGCDLPRVPAGGRDAEGNSAGRRIGRQRGVGPPTRGVQGLADRAEVISGASRVAQLVADEGRAAETDDFFRSRAFFDAEGVSHTLVVGGEGEDELALPLLVHEIADSGQLDAITPYGYPGAAIRADRGAPPDPGALDWSPGGLGRGVRRDRVAHTR